MAAVDGSEEQEEAAADWALLSEVEVLESIYLDELHVSKGNGRSVPWEISITLYPATAENQDSQYVCFTLVLSVPPQYPDEAPKIAIRNPRGLSDEQIQKISQALRCVTEAQLGSAMLYELIEKGKEILTDNNIPHGQCVICLYGFQENEVFTKTHCYHYFHSHCLARYTEHMEKEIHAEKRERVQSLAPLTKKEIEVQCPVCREPLVYDLAILKSAPPPQHPMEVYQPDFEALQHKEELHLIYKRQQEKGGIIDPEAERNRYFISLQKPPVAAEHEQEAISENVLDAKKEVPPASVDSENAREDAEAVSLEKKPEISERSSVLHNKRERIHGERPSFRGPARQLRYKPRETPGETHCLLTVEVEPRAFSRRSNWRRGRGQWSCGKYSQDFPKSYSRDQASSCTDKKELCTRGISLANEGSSLGEEKSTVGKGQPQGKEEDDLRVGHGEQKAPAKWQGQRGMPDCRRWEKMKVREYGSYPKVPRGRGWTKPSSRRESQDRETEGGS